LFVLKCSASKENALTRAGSEKKTPVMTGQIAGHDAVAFFRDQSTVKGVMEDGKMENNSVCAFK
jgi:hypothetical protein